MGPELARRWISVEALRKALVDMAGLLRLEGIEILVIKGLYYAYALGADPARRSMQDADAIVVAGSFDTAVAMLRRSPGWELECDDWSTKGFRHKATGGFVDLHRLPLPPCFGRVRSDNLRQRAATLPGELGPHVLVPDTLDAVAISLANYVKDRLTGAAAAKVVADLSLVLADGQVNPTLLASRLRELELRRIGIVAFTGMSLSEERWIAWLAGLSPTKAERRAATVIVEALHRHAAAHPDLSFLAVRAIADTPLRSLAGIALTSARLGRDRLRPLFGQRRRRWFRGAL